MKLSFDVVVVGGGISGSSTAAAIAKKGRSVLLCEAGLPSSKRLAGELMHPPAAERLEKLGLLRPLVEAGGVPTYGFVVMRDANDPGMMLSYSEITGARPTGLAIEHSTMCHTLLDAVASHPRVTVWRNARVREADLSLDRPLVVVERDGARLEVETGAVISAEGRNSKLREKTDIKVRRGEALRMIGYTVPGGQLPFPGYGHIFIGGSTPTLAYQMGRDTVRIMFEVGLKDGLDVPEELIAAIPAPFRADVREAIKTQPRQTARIYDMSPSKASSGKLAVVGDAGGCIHPITASGIAFCTRDAVKLAQALSEQRSTPSGVEAALLQYEEQRQGAMLTRKTLGPALLDVFSSDTPEMKLMRYGLFRYWGSSRRGRDVSMGLLSTQHTGLHIMAIEFAQVCAHSLHGVKEGVISPRELPSALLGLVSQTSRFLRN